MLKLRTSCGVEAVERLLVYRGRKSDKGEFFMSIRSLINLCEDVGVYLKAYWVSAEDLEALKAPFILYAPDQEHFVALKHSSRLPWISIPKRVVVITDQECNRFQELTAKEEKQYKGAKGEVSFPSAPAQPTAAESASQWADAMPKIYETQQKYAPLQAQMEIDLATKFAEPYGRAMKSAQEALYPGTSAIQEKLAYQATEGMSSGMPMWAKDQYLNELRANLGSNVGSGIAADYTSRGVMQMGEEWKRYNQNLGLSVTGRQPLAMAGTPATGQYSQNYNPQDVMSMNTSTYGSYAGATASMFGSASDAQAQKTSAMYGMFGTALGAGIGVAALSTDLVKEEIKESDVDALEIVKNLDVKEWQYIGESKKRLGIVLEESPKAFSEPDEFHMDIVTTIGYLTKAIQQLAKKLEEK
jgi:hypothetical protein